MSNNTIPAQALVEKFRQALEEKWGYIWGTAGEKWSAAQQKALEKTTDSNRAQGRKYGSRWIGHMVADCSGLFSWAFKHLGGYMYHGSDTMFRKYCVNKGELKDGKRTDFGALKPGTAVFVWNGKKYSHVGLYVGDETVIEAMGTINGVCTSKVTAGKWTHWGELVGVAYDNSEFTIHNSAIAVTQIKDLDSCSMGSMNCAEAQMLPQQLSATTEKEEKMMIVTVISSNGAPVNLRKKPEKGSALVDRIPVGTEAELLEAQDAWSRIRVKGKTGWMMTEFLESGESAVAADGSSATYSVTISGLDLTQAKAIMNNYPHNSTMEKERG